MPEGTYLNVAEFETVNELFDHMNAIANDEELYRSYFWPKFLSADDQQKLTTKMEIRSYRNGLRQRHQKARYEGCDWNDISDPNWRRGNAFEIYQDCVYRFN